MINLVDAVINTEDDKENVEKKLQTCIDALLSLDSEMDSLLVVYVDISNNAELTQQMCRIVSEKLLANGIYKYIVVPKDLVEIKQIKVIRE